MYAVETREVEELLTTENGADVELSVLITVRDPKKAAPIEELYFEYKKEVEKTGLRYEFIYVIEGKTPHIYDPLCQMKEAGEPLRVLVLSKWYGEATALNAGFEHAVGTTILMLPAYRLVSPESIPALLDKLDESDMVIVRRWPRVDGMLNRLQSGFFHLILRKMFGVAFRDLTCSVRAIKKTVVENVRMYGDQHRFLPILANSYGFKVTEIDIPQSKQDAFPRKFSVGIFVRRLLDLVSIFFLVKFTEKPLRFFGLNGVIVFTVGLLYSAVLVYQRLFMGMGLAERPVFLFSTLLVVLGIFLFAIGLVGELIIFVHSKDLKKYRIEKIIN